MTTVVRRDPLHLEFPEWMSRWLDDRGFSDKLWAGSGAIRVEELTEEGTHVIRADLPGVDPDKDVEISMHDGMLHITATRTEKREDRDNDTYRSEFHYGRFQRTVPLPAGATAKDVAATYADGVLEVRVPMETEAREAATIPVQRTS